jgi:hypothetical protein
MLSVEIHEGNLVMPIKAIELENFKGISSRIRVELKPITLLFGANSAGKSTILQALHYAREILARRNTDPDRTQYGGDRIDLGGFRNLVHNHDYSLPVILTFELDLSEVDLVDHLPLMLEQPNSNEAIARLEAMSGICNSATVTLVIKWSEVSRKPVQADYQVEINGEPIARIRTNPESPVQHSVEYNALHAWFAGDERWRDAPEEVQLRMAEKLMLDGKESWEPLPYAWEKPAADWVPLATPAIDSPERLYISVNSLIDELQAILFAYDSDGREAEIAFAVLASGNYLLQQLNGLRYLGPIREVPDRAYRPALSPDESRWASGLGAWDWIQQASQEEIDKLNSWLGDEERLSTNYQVELRRFKELDTASPLMIGLLDPTSMLDSLDSLRNELLSLPEKYRLVLLHGRSGLEVSPQDIGIGVSQVIPVIVAALDGADRLTAIEQPELHIHPALQVVIGDLFISAVNERNTFLLIETHSEHLLLRLLRRVRETSDGESMHNSLGLTPDQLSVVYVEEGEGGTTYTELSIDSTGEFTRRWPKGFFDERAKELF